MQERESRRPMRWRRTGMVRSSRHWFEVGHVDYLRALQTLLHELEPAA